MKLFANGVRMLFTLSSKWQKYKELPTRKNAKINEIM